MVSPFQVGRAGAREGSERTVGRQKRPWSLRGTGSVAWASDLKAEAAGRGKLTGWVWANLLGALTLWEEEGWEPVSCRKSFKETLTLLSGPFGLSARSLLPVRD
jgi:hypothetical protein